MICDKCGTSNPDNSRFCNFCGNPIQQNEINPDPVEQKAPNNQGPVIGMRPLFTSGTSQSTNLPMNNQQGSVTQNHQNLPVNDWQNKNSSNFKPIQSNPQVSPKPSITTPTPINAVEPQLTTNNNYCPQCHSNNPPGAAFCGVCGYPMGNAPQATPMSQEIICPTCHAVNHINAHFCRNCGASLSIQNPQVNSHRASIPSQHPVSRTSSRNLWVGIAGIGAILTLICFFLPNQLIKMANPLAWITEGPENITISVSGMQLLTLSSPTIKGLGEGLEGLGEFSENMYDEIDMGQLMFDSVDPATKRIMTFSRILLGLLLISSVAAIIITIQAYRTSGTSISKLMIILGGVSIVILIISTFIGNASFKTGNSDADLLLNSAIKFSNGLGFWGMLVGFASFSLGGYLRIQ